MDTHPTVLPVPKKRPREGSRPDVALRYARRKEISISCIAFKWSKLCSNALIRKHLPDLVIIVNKLTLFVYPFLDFYACRLVILQPDAHVKWGVELIRMACIGLLQKSNWKADQTFQPLFLELLQEYVTSIRQTTKGVDLLDDLTRQFKGLSFFVNELSAFMWTMCQNHLSTNMFSRVIKWIQLQYEVSDSRYATKLLLQSYENHTTCSSSTTCSEDTFSCELAQYIGMPPSEENICDHFDQFVKLSIRLLPDMEGVKGRRLFSIFPTKSGFSLSHVAFSNSSLQQFLTWIQKREKGDKPNEPYPTFDLPDLPEGQLITKAWFDGHKDEIWRTLFHVRKLERGTRTFENRMSTNGYSCSATMAKPKTTTVVQESKASSKFSRKSKTGTDYQLPQGFNMSTTNRIVGIDPGYSTLFCATVRDYRTPTVPMWNQEEAGAVNQLSLSTKQYRHESRMHEQRYYYQQLLKKDPEFETLILSTPSFKTTDPDAILAGVAFLVLHADTLFEKLRASALPKFKFKVKRFSAMTLTKHCKDIVGSSPTTCVVGVGDWSRSNKGGFLRGGAGAAPNKKFLHELRQRKATVVLIDEYKTSQQCFECKEKLEPVYLTCTPTRKQQRHRLKEIEEGRPHGTGLPVTQKVHHVLHCTNNECSMYWNRDVTSSLHHEELVRRLCRVQERPLYLRRTRTEAN